MNNSYLITDAKVIQQVESNLVFLWVQDILLFFALNLAKMQSTIAFLTDSKTVWHSQVDHTKPFSFGDRVLPSRFNELVLRGIETIHIARIHEHK